jgi:S1-C subfamily serine protease
MTFTYSYKILPTRMKQLLLSAALLALSSLVWAQQEENDAATLPKPLHDSSQPIDMSSGEWDNIIKIEVKVLYPDYREPWNAGQFSGGVGTGFQIGANRFLTNAHVVSNATRVIVRTTNDPEPHPAKVLHIAHDCDLALIEVEGGLDLPKAKPLTMGSIPKLNTEVNVIGYPMGGERISVTRGVVSRIDFQGYTHSGVDQHLAIQIDAAINPGNSGGPVLQNGKVVGVAFQGYSGRVAQNVGYMIPVPVIERFLKDIEDGKYDHYVDFAMNDFSVENPAQIKALGLKNDGIGIYVADVESAGSAAGVLKPGDVLLALDGNPVFNNGLIRIDGELMDKNEVVERKFAGDKVKVDFLRDGKEQSATIELKRFQPYLKMAEQYNQRPRYVLYSGMLFQPMDQNLMTAHQIRDTLCNYWYDNFLTSKLYEKRQEPVILTTVLADEVNSYLSGYYPALVDEINSVKINCIDDVKTALDKKEGEFVVVKLMERERPLVLKRSLAQEAHPRIMRNYGVSEDSYLGSE